MRKTKAERERKIPIQFYVDENEMKDIESNMKRADITSKSDYIRQMCVFGKVFKINDSDLKKCYNELNKIGVNVNQIAKIANETGSIYADDIIIIKNDLDSVLELLNYVYSKICKLENAVKTSGFETLSQKIRRIYNEKSTDESEDT